MQQLFDRSDLQKVQNHFCTLSRFFAYCVDMSGRKLTEMSGDAEGMKIVKETFCEEDFYRLYKHIADSRLEDILVESTQYDNVKLAAVAVTDDGERTNCWLICCVLKDIKEGKLLEIPVEGITLDDLYNALDLLATVEGKLLQNEKTLLAAIAESDMSKYSETEMGESLKRTEAMTQVVQFLGSNEGFEDTANEIMRITGEFLDVSAVRLFQVTRDEKHVDLISFYQGVETYRVTKKIKGLVRGAIFTGDKPLILSVNTLASASIRGEMLANHIKALIAIPIFVHQKPAMYFCVTEHKKNRSWRVEDVKFVNDVARVLQSLLDKRIQKNSLAGSYASLQEILDNVGTGIYVKDSQTGKSLFANKLLKQVFSHELKDESMDGLIASAKPVGPKEGYYEVEHKAKKRWYDLYHVLIGWIDGTQVDLYAFYDITDKKLYQKKIEQQAYVDFLTGLYNRMCCERDLAGFVDEAKQKQIKGALLYMDLDDFKQINDNLGHEYGDILLQSISRAFLEVEDVKETCYRMGGDEFIIIIPPEKYDRADDIIQDIKAIFDRPCKLKDKDYYCKMSMGVCIYPDDGDNVSELIKKADIAMYEMKKRSKGEKH